MAGLQRLSRSECRSRATIPVHGLLHGERAVQFHQRIEGLLGAGMSTIECDLVAPEADWCTVAALLRASRLARLKGGTFIVHAADPNLRATLRARGLASIVA